VRGSSPKMTTMKIELVLGSVAIAVSLGACAGHDDPSSSDSGKPDVSEPRGEAGTTTGQQGSAAGSSTGGSAGSEQSHGGTSSSNDDDDRPSEAGQSGNDDHGDHDDDGSSDPSGADDGVFGGGSGGVSTSAGTGGSASGGSASGGSASGGSASGGSASGGSASGDVAGGGSGGAAAGSGGVASSGGSAGAGGSAGTTTLDPEFLFSQETFGGNGRTCRTCHTAATGTVSAEQAAALYASDPNGPLFRPIDSDDGAGSDYTQLRTRATFRVTLSLPAGVHLASDPSATSITVRRGVPTTINTPALDPVLMWDGRQPDLVSQALSAILGHAQATVTPTSEQLELIASFEKGAGFFSSDLLQQYSQGGTAPRWPPGGTESEQRGRRWFAQDSSAPRFNICGQCHGGPMLNETQSNSGLAVGKHFQTVNVSEFNTLGNPSYELTFPDPKHPGQTITVKTPDPGRALITGDVRDLGFFKIPTLWGVKNTAPYFHDNSASTLEELVDHYERHLATFLPRNRSYPSPHVPTAQDKADIVAYLKLL